MDRVTLLPALAAAAIISGCPSTQAESCCWTELAVDWFSACGLHTSGEVECWGGIRPAGQDEHGDRLYEQVPDLIDVPPGEYSSLSGAAGCAVDAGGSVVCWGQDPWWTDLADVPAGSFTDVGASLGRRHACALDEKGDPTCWGERRPDPEDELHVFFAPPLGLALHRVQVSHFRGCGETADGSWRCWGEWVGMNLGQLTEIYDEIAAGRWKAFHNTRERIYALDDSGTPTCWAFGDGVLPDCNFTGALQPGWRHDSGYTDVAVGADHVCMLHETEPIDCFGDNSRGQPNAPPDEFVDLFASGSHVTCGLRADGVAKCWGEEAYGQLGLPIED